jgi:hypothetical protein
MFPYLFVGADEYCGDGICENVTSWSNYSENCVSCPIDCLSPCGMFFTRTKVTYRFYSEVSGYNLLLYDLISLQY